MKSIGAYFELQLQTGQEYYPSLIRLNTSRNALEYILRVKDYKTVYLPYYTCDVMLEPIHKLGLEHKFYSIDDNLDPIIDFELTEYDCFVYTNYFGIKEKTVKRLANEIKSLVIDNAQGFFSRPIAGIDTIYSCRKFFGISDGAYLQTTSDTRLELEKDFSSHRVSYLVRRAELQAEDSYKEYVDIDNSLKNNDIKEMSAFTQKMLSGINYDECMQTRNQNFRYLHQQLSAFNELNIDSDVNAPMIYPFLISKDGIKKKLIEQRIFVATYWPNVFEWTTPDMFENHLASHLIPLPVDHRYNTEDMDRIVKVLKELI